MGEASYGPAIQTKVSDEVYEKAEGEYVTTILSSSKLHMVAVDPAHRGRGHGRRLVNSAIDRLVKGGTVMIYGQFTGDRDLHTYYTSLGFDVLDKGEPLNMALATGKDFWLTPQPDDTMFVRHLRPRHVYSPRQQRARAALASAKVVQKHVAVGNLVARQSGLWLGLS